MSRCVKKLLIFAGQPSNNFPIEIYRGNLISIGLFSKCSSDHAEQLLSYHIMINIAKKSGYGDETGDLVKKSLKNGKMTAV